MILGASSAGEVEEGNGILAAQQQWIFAKDRLEREKRAEEDSSAQEKREEEVRSAQNKRAKKDRLAKEKREEEDRLQQMREEKDHLLGTAGMMSILSRAVSGVCLAKLARYWLMISMGSMAMGGGRVVRVAMELLVTVAQSMSFPPRGRPSSSSLGVRESVCEGRWCVQGG